MTATTAEKNGAPKRDKMKIKDVNAKPFEEQLADQMGWAKNPTAKADAIILSNEPFPTSKGSELLDLDQLFELPKNPRQDFDEADIEGLAESIIKTGGLMVAILCRPNDLLVSPATKKLALHPLYEIADGARRYRALRLLRQRKHPLGEKALVDIRPLTDAQLAEAFMTADRRKTLNPIEQARGFKNMLETGHTVETIAKSLGVSTGTVHGRLKLLELGKLASKWLAWGTLPAALATVIGRYPEKLQNEALELLLNGDDRHTGNGDYWVARDGCDEWSDDPRHKVLLAGACIEYLQENFTKSLKSTPFDQKAFDILVPRECWPDFPRVGVGEEALENKVVAPACGGCPKNSRNMAKEIAGDDSRGDGKAGFCTGVACYQAKWDATLQALRAKAKETGELKVLTPAQSAKALNNHYEDAPYAKASEVVHEDSKKRTWGQIQADLNKKLEEGEQLRKVIATTEDGKTELVEKAELLKALAADGVKWAKKEKRAVSYDYRAAQQRDQAKREVRERLSWELVDVQVAEIREKGLTLPILRAMVESAAGYASDTDAECRSLGLKESTRELEAFIEKKATMNDLLALLYRRAVAEDVEHTYGGYSEEAQRLAKAQKVDLKKREKEALKVAATQGDGDPGDEGGEIEDPEGDE